MNPDAIAYVARAIIPAALALLPESMRSDRARAMLLAIGLQESRFRHRVQIGGPARGYYQFESGGGVVGVLTHPRTAPLIVPALETLNYAPTVPDCYTAIAHNDVLATVFARLLLWTVPGALPGPEDAAIGWEQYIAGWRPGKPHRETWDGFYSEAWRLVTYERLNL